MVFLFPTNMLLPFCQKRTKMVFSKKSAFKDHISHITEKDDIHPQKFGISVDRKFKDNKKDCFDKKGPMILCTFMKTLIGVFI